MLQSSVYRRGPRLPHRGLRGKTRNIRASGIGGLTRLTCNIVNCEAMVFSKMTCVSKQQQCCDLGVSLSSLDNLSLRSGSGQLESDAYQLGDTLREDTIKLTSNPRQFRSH